MSVEQIAEAELPILEGYRQEKSHHFCATLLSGQSLYFGITPGPVRIDHPLGSRRSDTFSSCACRCVI